MSPQGDPVCDPSDRELRVGKPEKYNVQRISPGGQFFEPRGKGATRKRRLESKAHVAVRQLF